MDKEGLIAEVDRLKAELASEKESTEYWTAKAVEWKLRFDTISKTIFKALSEAAV